MKVFVFPVGNMLLYPSSSRPINVVEPRYVKMVDDAIKQNIPIALASVEDVLPEYKYKLGEEIPFVRQIVGYGKPVIVERHSDGSVLIFLKGQGKARLGEVLDEGVPYIVCEAQQIDENLVLAQDRVTEFITVQKVLVSWMRTHVVDEASRTQFLENLKTADEVIGCYANYIISDPDCQQMVLEENDINNKIGLVSRLIASGELL